jgi:hypothetical protein
MAPEVRMRRPIRYKPKTKEVPQVKTLKKQSLRPPPAKPSRPVLSRSYARKTLKRPPPNPFNQLNMNSANMLYDPKIPSPKVKLDSSKLFHKMEELQEMLKQIMKKRSAIKVSMNKSAMNYLNKASYEDPLLENNLKLKGIKGTTFG